MSPLSPLKRLNAYICIVMIKAIIYDMDDLMVRSDELHDEATLLTLREAGYNLSEMPADIREQSLGRRVIDVLQSMIERFHWPTTAEELNKRRQPIFLNLVRQKLEAMPGLRESLKLFKDAGYQIALASSGVREYVEIVLDKFEVREYFDVIVAGDEVKNGKPNPEIYQVAVAKLGLRPEECVVLEDADHGIAAAKAAGCKCIAIKNPFTAPQTHKEADLVLDSLNDITLEIVRSL